MPPHSPSPPPSPRDLSPHPKTYRIGCVSFLNAKPLIESLDDHPQLTVRYDVPSALLDDLESDAVDIALCPVIDYQLASSELVIVPVGGIGCFGPTLTVRLFSQIPIEQITTVHVDTHSHTSVNLLRILLAHAYNIHPTLLPFDATQHPRPHPPHDPHDPHNCPTAMLIIGDKVVTDSPLAVRYPHQLDLGEAWQNWTGLPFVFAIWMTKPHRNLGDLPTWLDTARQTGCHNIEAIVNKYATPLGWPNDLAQRYLSQMINYQITDSHIHAIEKYWQLTHALGLFPTLRPMRQYNPTHTPTKN